MAIANGTSYCSYRGVATAVERTAVKFPTCYALYLLQTVIDYRYIINRHCCTFKITANIAEKVTRKNIIFIKDYNKLVIFISTIHKKIIVLL